MASIPFVRVSFELDILVGVSSVNSVNVVVSDSLNNWLDAFQSATPGTMSLNLSDALTMNDSLAKSLAVGGVSVSDTITITDGTPVISYPSITLVISEAMTLTDAFAKTLA